MSIRTLLPLFLGTALVFSPATVLADDVGGSDNDGVDVVTELDPLPQPLPPPGSAPLLHGRLALSLAEAIAMGLENNLDVQVDRFEPLIADEEESIAWGAYDPE